MPFGMNSPITTDFADIVKYDAKAGRLFRVDYNMDTRQKVTVDITVPPPRFAIDFGSIEVGYGHFAVTEPEYHVVPLGRSLPARPADRDEQGRLKFRPTFRVKLYGKVLNGLREWASNAKCVLEEVDDLHTKFCAAPEAQSGKIPIVELSKTIPVTLGRGAPQRVHYAPRLVILGWTNRVPAMGERTVPIPPIKPADAQALNNTDVSL